MNPSAVPEAERTSVARPSGPSTLPGLLTRAAHRLLTHPAAMAAKAPVKHALWELRGRRIRNPPLDGQVRSLLFLCHGNICRSPFAAVRAAHLLAQAGLSDVVCASAGIAANQANECPIDARVAAERFGVTLTGHTPMLLTAAMTDRFDLLVVMEAAQMRVLHNRFDGARSRVVLLALMQNDGLRGYPRYNIADPFGHPRPVFDACYRRIDGALQSLVGALRQGRTRAADDGLPAR